jgi:diguanylate cyclase (GGDEF)-like protein
MNLIKILNKSHDQLTAEDWEYAKQQILVNPVTELPNRKAFNQSIDSCWKAAIRNKTPISIMFIDINKFKLINDTHGHLVGDLVINKVGQIINQKIRGSDLCFHISGDEFIVLCPFTTLEEANTVKDRLTEAIANATIYYRYAVIDCTVSIGLSTATPRRNESFESFIEHADKEMYKEKRSKVVV